jgi:hypothetical protein
MTTRAEAHERAERALALAAMCGVVFSGEDGDVVGAALAETMSIFLRNHRIVGDDRSQREMRDAVFEQWIKTVRDLLLIYDKTAGPPQ